MVIRIINEVEDDHDGENLFFEVDGRLSRWGVKKEGRESGLRNGFLYMFVLMMMEIINDEDDDDDHNYY